MLLRIGILLTSLSAVQPRDLHRDGLLRIVDGDFNQRFSLWPSVHNALLRIRRADASQALNNQEQPASNPSNPGSNHANPASNPANTPGPNEGIGAQTKPPLNAEQPQPASPEQPKDQEKTPPKQNAIPENTNGSQAESSPEKSNETPKAPVQEVITSPVDTTVIMKNDSTNAEKATKSKVLSNPEATKRGLIVFGGFALLAMAYFIFYRTKSKFNEASNANGPSESNQFRYGVLQSDDRRDNLELSRVPLTMESDDEEDEDLEIFDLGQKKKSLSYVNLKGTDEDIVLNPRQNDDKGELLLDIDDDNDVLINWSNNKMTL